MRLSSCPLGPQHKEQVIPGLGAMNLEGALSRGRRDPSLNAADTHCFPRKLPAGAYQPLPSAYLVTYPAKSAEVRNSRLRVPAPAYVCVFYLMAPPYPIQDTFPKHLGSLHHSPCLIDRFLGDPYSPHPAQPKHYKSRLI